FEQPAGCKYCRYVFRARWAEPVAAPVTSSVLSGMRPPVPHLDQAVLLERVRSLEVAVEQLLTQLAARTAAHSAALIEVARTQNPSGAAPPAPQASDLEAGATVLRQQLAAARNEFERVEAQLPALQARA